MPPFFTRKGCDFLNWWQIIKEIKVLSEAEVAEIVEKFKTAVEKGIGDSQGTFIEY